MTDDFPRLSRKERLILELLINHGEMYGLEMVKTAPGELKRGTVYVTLGRMADKGYVESRQVKDPEDPRLPQRVFLPTGDGRRVFQAWKTARAALAGAIVCYSRSPLTPDERLEARAGRVGLVDEEERRPLGDERRDPPQDPG